MRVRVYRLRKAMPGLEPGALFEHRDWIYECPDLGNRGNGFLALRWDAGNCQQNWAGGAIFLPGQVASHENWFEYVGEFEANVKPESQFRRDYYDEMRNKFQAIERIILSPLQPTP